MEESNLGGLGRAERSTLLGEPGLPSLILGRLLVACEGSCPTSRRFDSGSQHYEPNKIIRHDPKPDKGQD